MIKKYPMNLYFCLKPEAKNIVKAIRHIESLSQTRNMSNVNLVGLNCSSEQVTLTFQIKMKNICKKDDQECSEDVSKALYFMQSVFVKLFDYQPCYSATPTIEEKEQAASLLESLALRQEDSKTERKVSHALSVI